MINGRAAKRLKADPLLVNCTDVVAKRGAVENDRAKRPPGAIRAPALPTGAARLARRLSGERVGPRAPVSAARKSGKRHEMPSHHKLETFLNDYIALTPSATMARSPWSALPATAPAK